MPKNGKIFIELRTFSGSKENDIGYVLLLKEEQGLLPALTSEKETMPEPSAKEAEKKLHRTA